MDRRTGEWERRRKEKGEVGARGRGRREGEGGKGDGNGPGQVRGEIDAPALVGPKIINIRHRAVCAATARHFYLTPCCRHFLGARRILRTLSYPITTTILIFSYYKSAISYPTWRSD